MSGTGKVDNRGSIIDIEKLGTEEVSECIDWLYTIPYKFMRDGYVWSLLSVKNDFSKPESETFVHGEYENQYGHIKQFTLKEFRT